MCDITLDITVEDAVTILEIACSDWDPIYVNDVEIFPQDGLGEYVERKWKKPASVVPARSVKIGYHSKEGYIKSSLDQMVLDRLTLHKRRR